MVYRVGGVLIRYPPPPILHVFNWNRDRIESDHKSKGYPCLLW